MCNRTCSGTQIRQCTSALLTTYKLPPPKKNRRKITRPDGNERSNANKVFTELDNWCFIVQKHKWTHDGKTVSNWRQCITSVKSAGGSVGNLVQIWSHCIEEQHISNYNLTKSELNCHQCSNGKGMRCNLETNTFSNGRLWEIPYPWFSMWCGESHSGMCSNHKANTFSNGRLWEIPYLWFSQWCRQSRFCLSCQCLQSAVPLSCPAPPLSSPPRPGIPWTRGGRASRSVTTQHFVMSSRH